MRYLLILLILINIISCKETTPQIKEQQQIDSIIGEVNIDITIDVDSEKNSSDNIEPMVEIEPITTKYDSTYYIDNVLKNPEKYIPSIIGIYKNDSLDCKIEITKKGQKYFYHLITKEKKLHGELFFFERNTFDDEKLYILFREFWRKTYYYNDNSKVERITISETQASLYPNSILFQMYGNAEKDYETLFECTSNSKYLELHKQ